MKQKVPDYVYGLPDIFWKYFEEENFKDKPYPVNLREACEYLLFTVFEVDKQETIKFEADKNDNQILTGFDKKNFHRVFDAYHWKNLDLKAKITALYWFYEEICKELNIYKPQLIFDNKSRFGYPSNAVRLNITEKNLNNAYDLLDNICHELRHAYNDTYSQDKPFYNMDNYHHADYYNNSSSYEKFKTDLDYYFYFFQPQEVDCFDYALKRTNQVFLENKKANKGKYSDDDALYFYSLKKKYKDRLEKKNQIFKNNDFLEHLDKRYVLESLQKDISKITVTAAKNGDNNKKITLDGITFKFTDKELAKNCVKDMQVNVRAYNALKAEIEEDTKKLFANFKKSAIYEEVNLHEK